ncbi:hypothetical protein K501DRAFT_307603 [Backusella circina FSU 941]|nr:hypothetical protein K501DRAFT_307603 [Backusella circina FSU 941]
MSYNERIEKRIAEEMKRRLEVERAIAKEADVQTSEISKRFAEHHVILQKYFDTDQREMSGYCFRMMKKQGMADGGWNSLSQATKEQYEAQAKRYEDGENVDVKMQAVSRAVNSVKSIMKVANDVYNIPSVFIHGAASERNMKTADTSFASGLTEEIKWIISPRVRNSHKRKFEESFVPDNYIFPSPSGASKKMITLAET